MKESRSTETQIVSILKEVEAGLKTEQVCCNHEISSGPHYNWKSKYSGMEASDVKSLKAREEENSHLERMYANLSLEHEAVKELIVKKGC